MHQLFGVRNRFTPKNNINKCTISHPIYSDILCQISLTLKMYLSGYFIPVCIFDSDNTDDHKRAFLLSLKSYICFYVCMNKYPFCLKCVFFKYSSCIDSRRLVSVCCNMFVSSIMFIYVCISIIV